MICVSATGVLLLITLLLICNYNILVILHRRQDLYCVIKTFNNCHLMIYGNINVIVISTVINKILLCPVVTQILISKQKTVIF